MSETRSNRPTRRGELWARFRFSVIGPLLAAVEPVGLVLIFSGGLAYTGGIAFYVWNRLPYNHAIWHGFVLAGSASHFFAVLLYLGPAGA